MRGIERCCCGDRSPNGSFNWKHACPQHVLLPNPPIYHPLEMNTGITGHFHLPGCCFSCTTRQGCTLKTAKGYYEQSGTVSVRWSPTRNYINDIKWHRISEVDTSDAALVPFAGVKFLACIVFMEFSCPFWDVVHLRVPLLRPRPSPSQQ